MSKRYDLIKPLWDVLISSYEESLMEGGLMYADLAYASMDLSVLKFMRESDEGVGEQMKDARECIGTEPGEKREWKRCVKDYNRLSRFYRNQGIDVEPIVTIYDEPQPHSREFLKDRLLVKRTFRDIYRTEGRRGGLSEEEIKREIMSKGLNA